LHKIGLTKEGDTIVNNSFDHTKKAIWALLNHTGFHFNKGALFIGGIVFFLMTQSLMASGTIKGKVVDKDTKEGLTGANIVIKNTSMGAASDFNGNFTIYNVPDGAQTLTISYIGYTTSTLDVTVVDKETLQLDIILEPRALTGETVVITAQAQGQLQAINQQLSSDKIVNIVSEARIQELPDFNAAQAISRLPGVATTQSSGEANKVIIRGLAPQFNAVAVGGISLSSTGSTQVGATSLENTAGTISSDRSVDLSMVTPYMIKSIEVYKTLTPDMNANAVGGYVNMDLREAPSGFKTDLMFQSGYTKKSNNYGNYRLVASVSDRFLREKLGVYVLANVEQYDRDADNMNASYVTDNSRNVNANGFHPVRVQNVTLQRHIEDRKRYGGNLIIDYLWSSGYVKSINMVSRLNSKYHNYQTILDYSSNAISFSYRAGDGNTDVAVNSIEISNDFKFMTVNLKAGNNYSRNFLPKSPYYQFQANNAILGSTTADTRPEDLTNMIHYAGTRTTYLTNISLFTTDYKENDQTYKGDFKFPFNFKSSVSGYFKFGGEYRYNYHTNAQNTPYIHVQSGGGGPINDSTISFILRNHPNIQFDSTGGLFSAIYFTSIDPYLNGSFLANRFGGLTWVVDPTELDQITNEIANNPALRGTASPPGPGGWYNGPYQSLANSYKYIEEYYSGFMMMELDLGARLMIVGGARFEEVRALFDAYNLVDIRDPDHQIFTPVSVHPANHYWLPMMQAKYNFADWADVRYAYTQTLARPDYHQLTPHFTTNVTQNFVWAGNPKLVPAQAYNHDVLLTLHSNTLGLLSIGGFYKEIKNFTYYTQYKLHQYYDPTTGRYTIIPPGLDSVGSFNPAPLPGATLNTYINSPYMAYIRGVEIDFQTRFWYMKAPFNGVVLGINYSRISSKATYPWRDDRTHYYTNPRRIVIEQIDSTRSGRLINQPDHILNAYIGYDYKGFSTRVSFLFHGNSVNNIGGYAEQDGFTHDFYRVDASARYIIPRFPRIQLFLDLFNMNERANIAAQQTIGGFTSEQFYGLTANLGIRYTL
jgi:TonB-dependent receptor